MSATFIVRYAAAPVRFNPTVKLMRTDSEATPFTSAADAWRAIAENFLPASHCEVDCISDSTRPVAAKK